MACTLNTLAVALATAIALPPAPMSAKPWPMPPAPPVAVSWIPTLAAPVMSALDTALPPSAPLFALPPPRRRWR